MNANLLTLCLGAAAYTLAATPASAASPLPAATGDIECTTATGSISSPVSCDAGTDNGSVSYTPFAGVQAHALGEGLADEAGAFGTLNYSFEVIGGNPGDVVPLDIDTALQAVPISIGYAFAEILVTADGSTGVTICTSGCGVDSGVAGFTGTLQVDALSGAVYADAVHMEVDVIGALGGTADFDGGTASVDPHIYVDPSFPDADDYSVLFSDGIGNQIPSTTAVPEPATWAMQLLGFFGLGALSRCVRRRHFTQIAASGRSGPTLA